MDIIKQRYFSNGAVYAVRTDDGYPIEVTDTFLPYYTKECINEHTNELKEYKLGSRADRWMIGVSCMSGCPIHCRFCATGKLKRYRNLTSDEILEQVKMMLDLNKSYSPLDSKEFKINYTRMGEPFLNIKNVREAINKVDEYINKKYGTREGFNVHHYISTIGIKGSDFSWIKDNITLQLSLHSLDEGRRADLIPIKGLMSLEELGSIRTESNLKTTLNMTLVDFADFDIKKLEKYFDKDYFFIKLSPINENDISRENDMGAGIIKSTNLV